MQFTLKIDMDNAAFHDNPSELIRILEVVNVAIDNCQASPGTRHVLDVNGNSVGYWSIDA